MIILYKRNAQGKPLVWSIEHTNKDWKGFHNSDELDTLEISYGLEVLKVNGGKMKEAGVPKGFIIQTVNDKAMRSFDDLQDAVKDAGKSKDQMLVVKGIYPTGKRGGFVVYLQNE